MITQELMNLFEKYTGDNTRGRRIYIDVISSDRIFDYGNTKNTHRRLVLKNEMTEKVILIFFNRCFFNSRILD